NLIGDEPFAVLLADDYCANGQEGVLKQMVKLFDQHQCTIVAIEEVPVSQTESYGIVSGREIEDRLYEVDDMVEKPKPEDAPSNMAIIGRYILTPDIFDVLRNTKPGRAGEIQITDAIATQAKNGKVLAYKFHGKRFDCGSIEGFVEATNFVYENYYTKGSNYPAPKV
ncbi:MAG: sugar phosphate nucleotidyltransferase, partial [bacterium]